MTNEDFKRIDVSRRIAAPAAEIFEIVSNPSRHMEIDGSDMLRGSADTPAISGVGDVFSMQMHRLGRDYVMINHVVEFEPNVRLVWEPAPGDVDTAGGDPTKIGVPAGYQWGFVLDTESDDVTLVTHIFRCGPDDNRWILQNEGGKWINGHNSVIESMERSLSRLENIFTG
jgi:hypothetical protein